MCYISSEFSYHTSSRKMQNLFKILLFFAIISNVKCGGQSGRIKCNWGRFEHLCGNKCLDGYVGKCVCGSISNGFNTHTVLEGDTTSGKYCCVKDENSCVSYGKTLVICDGKVKTNTETCFGQCPQSFQLGSLRLVCDDKTQCYDMVFGCKGFPICKE